MGHPRMHDLLVSIRRTRNVGYRHAIVDRLAADCFRLCLLLRRLEHFKHEVARNEAYAGIVGDLDIEVRPELTHPQTSRKIQRFDL